MSQIHTALSWRPILGFEGKYEVSDTGLIRGCSRVVGAANGKTKTLTPRLLRCYAMASGHIYVDLYWNRRRTKRGVHTLVLEAFVGPAPDGHECCHRNGDPADNRVGNLYWGTRSDNLRDSVAHGTHVNAKKTHCPSGHPYSVENTYQRPRGGRICRICARVAGRAHKARKAVA